MDRILLLAVIGSDAEQGLPVKMSAARHHVPRHVVRSGLAWAGPQRRQVQTRYSRALDHAGGLIEAMAEQGIPARGIWERLLDEHDTTITNGSVLRRLGERRKSPRPQGEPPNSRERLSLAAGP